MVEYRRPEWRHVFLVGGVFLFCIGVIVIYDAVVTDMDKSEFCENRSGFVKYPVCERNAHKFCHKYSDLNLTILVDCDKQNYGGY